MAPARRQGWSFSAGERGRNRVRAYAHPVTGTMFVEFYETRPGRAPTRTRLTLGHRDPEAAKRAAEAMALKFLESETPRSAELTLDTLFEMYEAEVTPTKAPHTQRHDRSTRQLVERCWGASAKVTTLSRRDWDRFIQQRRSGELRSAKSCHRGSVRDRVIALDLKYVMAVLNWATVVRDDRGRFLLETNPLRGCPMPKEESPKRPVLTSEQYTTLLGKAGAIHPLFQLALILAREKRIGWHALRRLFATQLKHTPLKDLCYLGAWKNPQTILTCYQRPDDDTMRDALTTRGRSEKLARNAGPPAHASTPNRHNEPTHRSILGVK